MIVPVYNRILLKLSGEVLAGNQKSGIDFDVANSICEVIKECVNLGVQVGIVVGGGNFWRGRSSGSMDRSKADQMGMLATVMNSLALADTLEQLSVPACVQTAVAMERIAEPFSKEKAIKKLKKGTVMIFGCGTGNPYFTTDTAAALRAAEIEADIMFKASNVDGIYDKDPHKFADAKKYDTLSYTEILAKDLRVMDGTAASLCKDNKLPILVFNLENPSNIISAVKGENIGTIVKED